jgi:hypothetical protein
LGERLFANHLQPSNDPRGTVFAAAGVAADPTWPDDLRIAARTTRSSLLVSELVKHRIAREPLKDDIDFALLSLLSL